MYYFERARWGAFFFWQENGIPMFAGGRRISSRRFVWWMPTNWLCIIYLLAMAPLTLVRNAYHKHKGEQP
jgi:hypothetical protein